MSIIKALIASKGLTSQQIADFMLSADRERRAALRRGDTPSAYAYAQEVADLGAYLNREHA